MNPAISYYEDILGKVVVRADDFLGGSEYRNFKADKHLHAFTAAYGLPQQKFACFCEDKIWSYFDLGAVKNEAETKDRFLLKLVATWKDWRLYIHPVKISINKKEIFNGELFLENVCKGWPGLYFNLSPDCLKEKENSVEITNLSKKKNILIVERVEIIKRKPLKDFSIHFCPEFTRVGETFEIKLILLKEYEEIKIEYSENIVEFTERRRDRFLFRAKGMEDNVKIVFSSGDKECGATVGKIHGAAKEKIYIGMDCNDYRQDETDEMNRLLEHFAYTQMGNFVSFRPEKNRNYTEKFPAKRQSWERWINFCKERNIYFQFAEIPPTVTFKKEDILKSGGKNFIGFQFHEPYLVFKYPLWANPEMRKAENLLEIKNGYIKYLDERVRQLRYKNSKVSCGDPSLLCTYLKETKADIILCEPVSNCSLLFSAARGTGKDFGAHIALDWYLGFPHDEMALRRFSLLLNLIYAYGGKYIYVESALFKTNAFSRNDWEDTFCTGARQIFRNFYKFSYGCPREGKPIVPLGIVYGNLESIFWLPDDRIPELIDTKDWDSWDSSVWGKWKDAEEYRWLWKAAEAWLPPLEFEELGKNESLTKMFTGTPYGQVDVISPFGDYGQYKAIAFLGWNTMNEKIYGNLLNYAENGGIVFICGCHLDTRVDLKDSAEIINKGKVRDLIGADIEGKGEEVFDKFHLCRLSNIKAKEIEPFLYENRVGKGTVYFFNFYDYPYDFRLVARIEKILKKIGEEVSRQSEFSIEGKNKKYINYNLWQDGDTKRVYLTNIDWQKKGNKKKIKVRFKGKTSSLEIEEGRMYIMSIKKDSALDIERNVKS